MSASAFSLHVRGEIPRALQGSLLVPCSRRHKDRRRFSRWQDAQADLLRLDVSRSGISGRFLALDQDALERAGFTPSDEERELAHEPAYGYATQPNHGVNVTGDRVWATNLLFGAPLEIDLARWEPRRLWRALEPTRAAPRLTGTAHFAQSLDGQRVYHQQSLLEHGDGARLARATAMSLVELDLTTGRERLWRLAPPLGEDAPEAANFHSAFYFEEQGARFVGLLRTGALVRELAPHAQLEDHQVVPMAASDVWVVKLDAEATTLQAEVLPGIGDLGGLALSHLDVDARGGDGFVLYANYKEAAVGEESHGPNVYGEPPEAVFEHYSGMTVEPLRPGTVVRYERRGGRHTLETLTIPYDPARTSRGHTWLPINLQLDRSGERLFCSFAGFRPRQLSRHIAAAYPGRVVDPKTVRYIPPLVSRLDAKTLRPDGHVGAAHSYAESVAIALGEGSDGETYLLTFAPEAGLRIYRADDLEDMLVHAVAPELMCWEDSHFRPDPAHAAFVAR